MLRKKSLLALLLFLCMVVGILPARVFAAGQYVPENPRWSGYGNQVMWDKPANASGSTYLEYEAQLVLNGQVLQTESVEIDRWVFFDSKNITQSKDAYTLKVRARQIYLTGDPDGSYTVWKRDAWGDWAIGGNTGGGEGPTPPHEHSFGGWKNNGTQHWKECSCGEKSEESPHNFGEWELIYYDVNTKYDVCERQCLTCGYEQIDRYREHQHYYTDDWSSGSTTHWKVCYYCKEVNQDTVANHTFDDWTITKEPTTTETGSRERTCSICKYKQEETIPVHEHSYGDWQKDETQHWKECSCGDKTEVGNHTFDDWTITKEPTTTETGSRERTCSICKYKQEETIPVHEHSYGDWQKDETQHWKECRCGDKTEVGNHTFDDWTITKEPTTTETGSRERTCSICKYKQEETIPVHEHSYGDWQKDETQHWKECSCGDKTEVGNHTFDDWTITKEPTTTETGSRERTCSICKYKQEETIPVHEHSYGDWQKDETQHWKECSCGDKTEVGNHTFDDWTITKEPTTTETGSRERTCSICKYKQEETIPVHEHSYGDWQKDETQHWKECRCGDKTEVGNHTFDDWTITKEPTTTETGSRERTCSICKYKQEETIPVHEHSYGDWQKDETQHWKECSCGDKTEVGNHTFDDWTITKEPTTTETGSRERTCSICKYKQEETIPVHEHSYGDWQKDETQHWKECSCGDKTEVGNHTFDDWTITKEPTTTETGSRERTCSICKYKQEETIPVHEHSYGDWQKDETQHWKECRCGDKTEVGNHTFDDWTITKEPTTTETGSRERTCSICKYKQEETIPVHEHSYGDWQKDETQHWKECSCGDKTEVGNHTFDDWTITKEPTTTETGSRERTCSICKYKQEETIPVHEHSIHDETWKYNDTEHWQECSCGEKLNVANHIYGDWRVTKEATETEEGSRERDCTVCDYVQTETIPMLEHEHSYGDWQKDETQHWKECSCGERLNVANHIYGDWKVTKEATETEVGSRERGCTVCEYVQVEIIPEIGHEHGIHDETWKYDETDHWQECSCGEKLNVANHTYGDWKVTKEATETEAGSRERGCAVCEYVQTEAIPAAGTGEPTDPTDPTTPTDPTEPTDPAKPEQPGKPSGQTESPQTGDGSDMALWIGLMMASCGGVLGMLFYRRKKAAAGK